MNKGQGRRQNDINEPMIVAGTVTTTLTAQEPTRG